MADNTIRVEGNYGAEFLSVHSEILAPNYLSDVYRTYGKGFDLFDLTQLFTRKGTTKGRTLRFFEKNHWKPTITTSTAIAVGAAGADITFKIAAADYDGNGKPAIRVWETFYIPQAYQTTLKYPAEYQVVSRSGSAGDYTFTAKPLKGTARIGVEVPIGTEMSLGSVKKAPGTGLPEGTVQGYFERSYTSTILKGAKGIEGGFLSENFWTPIVMDGKTGYLNPMLTDLEMEMDDSINSHLWMGQKNENATLTEDSYFGGTNKVLSDTGLWPVMDALAQQLWYTDAWTQAEYKTAKDLFEQQGVMVPDIIFAMGTDLFDETDIADENYIKEYSGGSDLITGMNKLGFQATTIHRHGINFHKVKLNGLTNPFSFGNEAYNLKSAGFMAAANKSRVSVDMNGNKNVALGNVELRFLANGQEDRSRVLKPLNGISGIAGSPAVNEYDGIKYGMMSELIALYTNVNQMVQIRKELV